MIETNIKNLSVQEIMQKIKIEVEKRKDNNLHEDPIYTKEITNLYIEAESITAQTSSKFYLFAKRVGKFLQRIGLYSFVYFVKEKLNIRKSNYIYIIEDFLRFHDKDFIKNSYKNILQREVDSNGMEYYLTHLRNGMLSKADIVVILHHSKEGKAKNVIIIGTKKRFILLKIYKIPLIGYIVRSIVTLLTLPKLIRRINQSEADIGRELYKYSYNSKLIISDISTKVDKIELETVVGNMESKADKTELEYKADKTELEHKADKIELEHKADKKEL